MSCHSQIGNDSPALEPVRESYRSGQPIVWTRVHRVPDYLYFNHSIHVNKGVSCASCHGQVDQMPLVWKAEPVEIEPVNQLESLRELVGAMAAGTVDTLFILGSNPVYTALADFDFATHLANVDWVVQNSLYNDETGAFAEWHIPQSHYLEAWSDVRASDGTATIIQPLIAPLFNSRTEHEVLAALLGEQPLRSAYEIVRQFWDGYYNNLDAPTQADSDRFWRDALHDGVVAGTKALLVILYFMHVRYSDHLTWLYAAVGFIWLGILIVLTLSDYVTRGWFRG